MLRRLLCLLAAAIPVAHRQTLAVPPAYIGPAPQLTDDQGGLRVEFHDDGTSSIFSDRRPVTDEQVANLALTARQHAVHCYLRKSAITDAALATIGGMRRLRILDLSWTRVSGSQRDAIAKLETVQVLYLEACPVTEEALESIGKLPNLEGVYLYFVEAKPEVMERVTRQNPRLRVYWSPRPKPEDFEVLQRAERSGLSFTPAKENDGAYSGCYASKPCKFNLFVSCEDKWNGTASDLLAAARVEGVRHMILRGKNITNDHLAALKNARALATLHLDRTAATVSGIKELARDGLRLRVKMPLSESDRAQLRDQPGIVID